MIENYRSTKYNIINEVVVIVWTSKSMSSWMAYC